MAKKRKFVKRLFIVPVTSLSLFAAAEGLAESNQPLKAFQTQLKTAPSGYTVNFNNVSMLELVKFISKISNTNFVYDEAELQFTVTFTSEEPTSLDNIMTAFSQILRIHGLSLLEEGNNIVIHKNEEVKQIPPIVGQDDSEETALLVTRVFSIRNANPKNLETVLAPMLSQSALITTLLDTRQIILMDIATNVQKVAELIAYLDTPSSNLQMQSYKFKNANAESVALILNQLITPLSEGNPVILTPQEETNSLFMVSTPYLLKKSREILLELDDASSSSSRVFGMDNLFIYQLGSQSYPNLKKSLDEIITHAIDQGYDLSGLDQTIKTAQFLPSARAIVFIGNKMALERLKSFLSAIDSVVEKATANQGNQFFIFEPSNKSAEEIYVYLKEIEKHLMTSHLADPNLLATLDGMQLIIKNNTILFAGTKNAIEELTVLLKTLDLSQFSSVDEFLIYTPLHLSPQTLMESLRQVSKRLSQSGLSDVALLKSIETAQYVPSSYAIVFSGSSETIVKVKKLMDDLDTINKRNQLEDNMLVYKLKYIDKKSLDQALESFAETVPIESPIQESIESRTYLSQSNSIVFRGSQETLDKIKQVIEVSDTVDNSKDQVLMYPIKSADESVVLDNLKTYLTEISPSDRLYEPLKGYKYVPASHLIIFKGSDEVLKEINQLMTQFDQMASQINFQTLNYKVRSSHFKTVVDELKKVQEKLSRSSPLYPVLKNAQVVESSRLIIFKGSEGSIKDLEDLLSKIDTGSDLDETTPTQLVYNIKNSSGKELLKNLNSLEQKLKKEPSETTSSLIKTLESISWIESSNSLVIVGPKKDVDQVVLLITQFDRADLDKAQKQDVLNYKIQSYTPSKVVTELKTYTDHMQTRGSLYDALKSMRYLPDSKLIVFIGSNEDLKTIQGILNDLDTSKALSEEEAPTHLTYPVTDQNGPAIMRYLESLQEKMKKDPAFESTSLATTLKNVEWSAKTQTILIAGPKRDVDQVISFIKQFDALDAGKQNSEFLLYRPQFIPAKELKKSVDKITADLEQSQLSDPLLLQALKGIKFSEHNQALIITGNEATLKKVKEILASTDLNPSALNQPNFFNYHTQVVSAKDLKKQLLKIVEGINTDPELSDPQLIKAIENAQVIETSNSVLFTGSEPTITKIKQLVATVDTLNPKEQRALSNSNFFIYRPSRLNAKQIKSSLESIAIDFEKTQLSDTPLIHSLKESRLVEDNRSLLFTGSEETLTKVKELLTTVDIPQDASGNINTHFILYKPTHLPLYEVHETLLVIAKDLEKSGLSDPKLIATIRSSKVIEASHSIAFTGDESTLAKAKELAESVDIAKPDQSHIQHVGQTTFMIYKIKEANPILLMESLRALGKDLNKSKGGDFELVRTIDNMRYIEETQSIVFTGPAQTLTKISSILEKFDTASTVKPVPERSQAEDYSLYEPKNVPGEELIHLLKEFEISLKSTGIQDKQLIDTISNLKWMPKTQTIIVTGTEQSITKTVALLNKFDVPGRPGIEKKADTSIETIEDTSFLIYKVQYHNGSSILDAVQGIGRDLKKNPAASTQALVSAIQSLQFIKVTNSMVATGDPKALTRLKELIQSVDVPLKQVFIELLVIETDLSNLFQFGLRWASQGNYKDRLGFSAASLPPSDQTNVSNINFSPLVQAVNATTPPDAQKFPMPTGGSLGVIGDLIFHKGKTYISLGDFVNAIQTDNDSTIVLNQKIITQDNRDSSLFVGQNVPYTGSVVQNTGQNATVISSNIEYMDIGIKLEITPKVGEDDIITMDISQNISEEINSGQLGSVSPTNTVYGIQTRKTTLNTSVHVPNEHFVVLTGQIRTSSIRNKTAIPCLGGLPLIGAAFSDNLINKQSTTIVMFIKPHIVNSYEEYKRITGQQEDLYRDHGIAEDFDTGIEMVKTPDDQ